MQIRYVTVVVALAGLCFGPIAATHVAAAQRPILNAIGNLPREYYVDVTYNDSYDARDFSGIWFRVGGDWSHGPPRTNPPLTPEGLALMQTHRPTRSYLPEVTEAVASYEETNYPAATCNPKGFPAIVVDLNHDHHEVLVLGDRILQVWQEERMLREIWMDGRELPSGDNLANIGPSGWACLWANGKETLLSSRRSPSTPEPGSMPMVFRRAMRFGLSNGIRELTKRLSNLR